ncbi:MAG: cell division ATP-binding protein FtsE [Thermodesulfobacteriota bacterium]
MIQLFNVSKHYDKSIPALVDVTLKVEKGEFVFVTGPSGAGKTTLLKLICGTEMPSSGQMIIDRRNYQKIPKKEIPYLRRRIGFVFQDFKLIPSKTVFENVALTLKITGVSPGEIRTRVMAMLSYLRIKHRANFMPLALSGGEQQRVAIARALVKKPAILLADEPTGNLDPELALETMELFSEVNSKGTTVVVATHDQSMIERFNTRVITLEAGGLAG